MATKTQTRTKRPTTPKSPPKAPPQAVTPPAATELSTSVEPPVEPVEAPVEPANAARSGISDLGTSLLEKIDQVRTSFAYLAPEPPTDGVLVNPDVDQSGAVAIAERQGNEEIRRSPTIIQILTTIKQSRWS